MNINYNYIELILKNFSDNHPNIQGYKLSFEDQRSIWQMELETFPKIYGVITGANFEEQVIDWDIDIYILDLLFDNRDNEVSIMNNTQQIVNDFVTYVQKSKEFGFSSMGTARPLNNFDENRMNGWVLSCTINTKREQCFIPDFDEFPFGFPAASNVTFCNRVSDCDVIINIQDQINNIQLIPGPTGATGIDGIQGETGATGATGVASQSLSDTLTIGDTTLNGQTINALNGGGQLDLRASGDNIVALTNDNGVFAESGIYFENGYAATFIKGWSAAYELAGLLTIGKYIAYIYTTHGMISIWDDDDGKISLSKNGLHIYNTTLNPTTMPAEGAHKLTAFLASPSSSVGIGVKNSVALGGSNIVMKTNNTAYVTQLGYSQSPLGGSFDLIIDSSNLTADRAQTFQDASGTVSLLGDEWQYSDQVTILGTGSLADPFRVTNLFDISINFIDAETWNYRAPEDFKINSVDNPDSMSYSIQLNSATYSLGGTISQYDYVDVNPGTYTGFLNLNSELL